MKTIISLVLALIWAQVLCAQPTEKLGAPHIRIEWLAPTSFGSEETHMGLRFQMDPEWHVYWKNPGDSGAAPKFQFSESSTPTGLIEWPTPKRLPIAHLTNLGYEKEVVYLFKVKPSGTAVHLETKIEWLVCKEECIPGFGTLTLDRPVRGSKAEWDSKQNEILTTFENRLPINSEDSPWKLVSAEMTPTALQLNISSTKRQDSAPQIFPIDGDFLSAAEPTTSRTADGFAIVFKTNPGASTPRTTGFIVASDVRAWEFREIQVTGVTTVGSSPIADSAAALVKGSLAENPPSLLILLLMAFAGGVILNLMPCVFPVLSIKLLSLVKQNSRRGRVREALLYSAGVVVTFFLLGAGFLILRAAGQSIGWGFQLQSPRVVLALALLFWLMALNFLGVFEMGNAVMNVAGRGQKWNSSFATGVLSVFVAAPCTGPFMGSALGAATTLPSALALLIFIGLGLGLSAPFLVLASFPFLSERLPKPGRWMEQLKEFLAFPLFATVLWLLWVLGQQAGDTGWVVGGSLLLITGFAIWLLSSTSKVMRVFALAMGVVFSFGGIVHIKPLEARASQSQKGTWQPYDRARLEKARAEGQSVFVDFTAAWCISCQVNKKAVLETDAAEKLFADHKTLLMQGDWTDQNPVITAALAEFGRASVPMYLFYSSQNQAPKILPQVLTISMIEELYQSTQEDSR